ncbi:hypothetical protein HN587_03880 [Candidatus Woesearchaeota archaeon]|jgi:hypothetical protein|nr:hypothetical protein [Candidatus Woesearchaeota archaeon]
MNKRASLSLSINAIVILVLAITMLGLGLAFTKGMFSKFASKLEVPPPNIPATAEEPIVLPDESIEILKNKDFEFTVNFYNDAGESIISPTMACQSGGDGFAAKLTDGYLALQQNVPSGIYKPFKFILNGPQMAGKAICTLSFADADNNIVDKQIVIMAK